MVQSAFSVADFDFILKNYAGRLLSHTPYTKTESNYTGEETITAGTGTNILCYVMKTGQNFDFKQYGFIEKGNMVGLFKVADSVTLNSLITVNGEKYRVKESFDVPGVFDSAGTGTVYVYTVGNLFKAE